MTDESKQLVEQLQALLERVGKSGEAPYIFSADEVRLLQKLMKTVATDEQFLHLRRAIDLTSDLTDRQIEAIPALLDGAVFMRRMGKVGFWVLVALGTMAANWQRIKEAFAGGVQ